MTGSFLDLIQNPLIIAGILMALTVLVYFSLEFRHMIHKTKKERAWIIVGWGVFLAIIAIVLLFTTSLNVIANSAGLLPKEFMTNLYTLNEVNSICTTVVNSSEPLVQEHLEGCDVVRYIFYSSYFLLFLSIILFTVGFVNILMAGKKVTEKDKLS